MSPGRCITIEIRFFDLLLWTLFQAYFSCLPDSSIVVLAWNSYRLVPWTVRSEDQGRTGFIDIEICPQGWVLHLASLFFILIVVFFFFPMFFSSLCILFLLRSLQGTVLRVPQSGHFPYCCSQSRKISLSIHRAGSDPAWILSGWCIGGSSMASCSFAPLSSSPVVAIIVPAHRGVKPVHPRHWAVFFLDIFKQIFQKQGISKRMR